MKGGGVLLIIGGVGLLALGAAFVYSRPRASIIYNKATNSGQLSLGSNTERFDTMASDLTTWNGYALGIQGVYGDANNPLTYTLSRFGKTIESSQVLNSGATGNVTITVT